jgi:hypothetical protein
MFAIYRSPLEPWLLSLAAIAATLFCWAAFRSRWRPSWGAAIQMWVTFLLLIYLLAAWMFLPVARIPREYYEGKDQFEWAGILRSADGQTRERAITALCDLLKRESGKDAVRSIAVRALLDAGAKEAIPVFHQVLKSEDEDLRSRARYVLDRIDIEP